MASLSQRVLEALMAGGPGLPNEVARRQDVGADLSAVRSVLENLEALHKVKRSPRNAYYVPGYTSPADDKSSSTGTVRSTNTQAKVQGAAIRVGDHVVQPGQRFTNRSLMQTFGVSNSGGMRRSKATNTLLLISHAGGTRDQQPYQDRWREEILHYTGMGMTGDQDLRRAQNDTLARSEHNGVLCLLFESPQSNEYVFIGRVVLAGGPYEGRQPDATGLDRRVWIFPLRVAN